MSRKDYIKIADLLAKHNVTNALISDFMEMLKCDNRAFDKTKFMEYIDKQQNK